jgi:crotonobetainyl-CoA:carnitine CoA-transferase CaiB-like acyl-CoA transferase
MGALDGIRVIDFGQWLAGPLTAMMLADQGAEVIHVDPPGGPRWKSPANATLNRGKQRLSLDLKSSADVSYARRLIETADVVIENFRPGVMDRLGLGAEATTAANPRLVYTSLPGFAHDDRRAAMAGWEGVIAAATGTYFAAEKPRFTAIMLSSSFAALSAAISTVMALIARERDGLGQRIEVPLFDATFLAIGANGLLVDGKPEGGRPDDPWTGGFEAKDGRMVRLNLASPSFIRKFAEGIGRHDWVEKGYTAWPTNLVRGSDERKQQAQDLIDVMKTRTAAEWDSFGREVDIPMTMLRRADEWIETEQARDAGIITELDDPELGPMRQPGPAVRLYGTPGAAQGPRAEREADRDALLLRRPSTFTGGNTERLSQVLAGLKVVDITQVLAGPTATRTLAEFGAEVVKINNPWEVGAGYRWNRHRYHTDVNRGKETALVDLKTPEGLDLFWRLAGDADVVMQNFRRGVAERLGLGYEQVRARNPGVIYGSVSFFGYDGPWQMTPGYEPNAQASTGLSARQGGPLPFAVNDYSTGLLGAFALSLALFHRERTGEGQHVTTSLAAAGTFLQTPYMQAYEGKKWDEPSGPDAVGWSPLQRLYRASDGWLFLGASKDNVPAMAKLEGLGGIDMLDGAALASALEAAIASKPADDWVSLLASAGAGAQKVVPAAPLMHDNWVIEHGLSVTRTHKGGEVITTIGPPPRLSRTPVVPGIPVSKPGADALEVLTKAGLADRLDDYVARKIVVLE